MKGRRGWQTNWRSIHQSFAQPPLSTSWGIFVLMHDSARSSQHCCQILSHRHQPEECSGSPTRRRFLLCNAWSWFLFLPICETLLSGYISWGKGAFSSKKAMATRQLPKLESSILQYSSTDFTWQNSKSICSRKEGSYHTRTLLLANSDRQVTHW